MRENIISLWPVRNTSRQKQWKGKTIVSRKCRPFIYSHQPIYASWHFPRWVENFKMLLLYIRMLIKMFSNYRIISICLRLAKFLRKCFIRGCRRTLINLIFWWTINSAPEKNEEQLMLSPVSWSTYVSLMIKKNPCIKHLYTFKNFW